MSMYSFILLLLVVVFREPIGLPTYKYLSGWFLYLLYASALVGQTMMEFLSLLNSNEVAPTPVLFLLNIPKGNWSIPSKYSDSKIRIPFSL